MTDSYDQARAVADAVPGTSFVLPAYTGSATDLGYLKQWVLSQVTAIYGVSASVFDEPTVFSTSILRDFVHRALEDVTTPFTSADALPSFQGWGDVGLEFRGPAHGLCGEMAWQEYEVFRAFGYQTAEMSSVNSTPDAYTDGHVSTEVYVNDLQKYMVQDATFNYALQDTSGNFLDFDQARVDAHNGTLVFNGFNSYTYYWETGSAASPELAATTQAYIQANYLNNIYWWYGSNGRNTDLITNLFPDTKTAHSATSSEGSEFASLSAAQSALTNLIGMGQSWQSAATTLRGEGYYVSGFELTNGASAAPTSQWLTLRLSDGTYASLSMTGSVLNGSLDQIENEATDGISSGPPLNPGADLSAFYNPMFILGYNGTLMNTGVSPNVVLPHADYLNASKSDYLIETSSGAVQVGQVGSHGLVSYYSFGASLGSGGWQLVGSGNYIGEVQDQFLIVNTSGALYFGHEGTDGQVTYHSLVQLAPGWQVIGSGNYLGQPQDQFLVENTSTGVVDIGQVTSTGDGQAALTPFARLGTWTFVGTGDYLELGHDEFLIENASGALYTGTAGTGGQGVYHSFAQLASGWQVVGSGDFLGLGFDQFLVANAGGTVEIGQLGTGQEATLSQFAALGAGWKFEGVGDYLGEGHDQFLIENGAGVLMVGDDTGGSVHLTQIGTLASQWTIHG